MRGYYRERQGTGTAGGTAPTRRHERGVFALMSAVLLLLIFIVLGLGLGLAQLYNRKVELQEVANAVALAAARELNGTDKGVTAALQKAAATAARFHFNYQQALTWSDAAITFAETPQGSWTSGGGIDASKLFYVNVDAAKLGQDAGLVSSTLFMAFVTALESVPVGATAIAGRVGNRVTPLAVCALSTAAGVNRATELVEYGFRRGVVYDLLKLNPGGVSGESFVVDPIVAPGTIGTSYNTSVAVVGPFVCTGTMWTPRVTGGDIQVTRPFPIASLYMQLNSRFDQFGGNLCSPNGAPPDMNVKSFTGPWMSPAQDAPLTKSTSETGQLLTIADIVPVSAIATTKSWGALWSYAKPAKFSSYKAGETEPQAPLTGYATFDPSSMATLYQAGVSAPGYPSPIAGGTPYKSSITFAPNNKRLAEENRRVLNIPLLKCPVPAGTNAKATVLAVGKFFMTNPATTTSVAAEFAGIAPETSLVDQVELFQ